MTQAFRDREQNKSLYGAGRFLSPGGYWVTRKGKKQVKEHRLIAEEALGRSLAAEEVIHHINGNRQDNQLGNLYLFPSASEHSAYHRADKPLLESNLLGEQNSR